MNELIAHLRANALRTDGPFRLRSGATSSWYLDARKTTFSGDGAWLVGRALLAVIRPEVSAVGGMTMGADPMSLAAAMAGAEMGRSLRAFSVRKDTKAHGTGGRLVGPVEAGEKVAVLDDTVTTGGALSEAIDVLELAQVVVTQVIVLVDRSYGVVEEICRSRNLEYTALIRPADLGVE
ncbi:MAG: orotate phosphoribosyltransferase [Acidimicrobiia bacterium]|nr:orotate phosphoribosyltransferase [Acidimicrobiia bacterium]MDQ3500532.1 orotate phosphoribosyltransferase [Actinomycetota bacterium]